jgi:hypothetical protein
MPMSARGPGLVVGLSTSRVNGRPRGWWSRRTGRWSRGWPIVLALGAGRMGRYRGRRPAADGQQQEFCDSSIRPPCRPARPESTAASASPTPRTAMRWRPSSARRDARSGARSTACGRACVELGAFLNGDVPEGGHDPTLLQAGHVADYRRRERDGLPSPALVRSDGTPALVTGATRADVFDALRRLLTNASKHSRLEQARVRFSRCAPLMRSNASEDLDTRTARA